MLRKHHQQRGMFFGMYVLLHPTLYTSSLGYAWGAEGARKYLGPFSSMELFALQKRPGSSHESRVHSGGNRLHPSRTPCSIDLVGTGSRSRPPPHTRVESTSKLQRERRCSP